MIWGQVINRAPLPRIGAISQILLLCSRETLSEAQGEKIHELCEQVDDWDKFVDQAAFRLILPLVSLHFGQMRPAAVPPRALEELRTRSRRIVMHSLAIIAVHHRLVRDVLEPLGIPYLFFKGPSLAYRYYRNPVLRVCRDIDLLIPRRHMVEVGRRLREVGFRSHLDDRWATDDGLRFRQRFVGMMDWISPEGVLVEMPSSLDSEWGRLPTDELIAQAETVTIGELTIPVVCSLDFLSYMCRHHTRHHWARLHWIADLSAILESTDFDLEEARAQAIKRGFDRTVEAALAIHEAASQPEPWKSRFEDPFAHEVFRYCLINQEGDFAKELTLRASFSTVNIDIDPKRRKRRNLLARSSGRFKPSADDFLHWPLPYSWHSAYYLVRPVLWAIRMLRSTLSGAA